MSVEGAVGRSAKRVYLWGWFGRENSGDDALLLAATSLAVEADPRTEIVVEVPSGGRLPALPDNVQVLRIRRRFKGDFVFRNVAEIVKSDVVLWGGGSILSDVNSRRSRTLIHKLAICKFAKALGKDVIFSALGVGPLVTQVGRDRARSILNTAALVQVRDQTSADLCREIGVTAPVVVGFDPAVLLGEGEHRRERTRRGSPLRIGLSLSASSGTREDGTETGVADSIVTALTAVAERVDVEVVAIQMCAKKDADDLALAKAVLARLPCRTSVAAYDPDPKVMMQAFAGCDAVIAERLHAAIFAYTTGIPLAVIPYHAKCAAFADDIRLPALCRMSPEPTVKEISAFLDAVGSGSSHLFDRLPLRDAVRLADIGRQAVIRQLRS